jgi:hypothetical protein
MVNSSADGVVVSTDGGVQVASNALTAYAVVDIILCVDMPDDCKELSRRRVFAVNTASGLQTVANWSFSVVDHPNVPGLYAYKVKAQLIQTNTLVGAYVSGPPPPPPLTPPLVLPWLHGTLTGVVINK